MAANPLVVLYVEDAAFIRVLYAQWLAAPQRRIVSVADCASAHDALGKQNVDLLITDIQLPDGSGLDLAREALRRNPGLPVIVCSGEKLMDVTGLLGPTAHMLSKPIDFDELEALIEKLVQ